MMLRDGVLFLAVAVAVPALACSPAPQYEPSGFPRAEVSRLPKNALGVMFVGKSVPLASEFRVESAEDKRPHQLRIRTLKGVDWVRVELVHGFQPGARYRFRYLPAHGEWAWPDQVTVSIDDAKVDTAGSYAIVPAAQPIHRIVHVPGSAMCVEPLPVVAQEFTYALPASLGAYRETLAYLVERPVVPLKTKDFRRPSMIGWPTGPDIYHTPQTGFGRRGHAKEYTAYRNAVVAPCGNSWSRVRLRAGIAFPELDDKVHRPAPVEINLARPVEGGCGDLEVLLQTMHGRFAEKELNLVCGAHYPGGTDYMTDRQFAALTAAQWDLHLTQFNGISATCHMMGLSRAWEVSQRGPDAATAGALGNSMQHAFKRHDPPVRDEALHSLHWLLARLPEAERTRVAPHLLAPLLPVLVATLAEPRPKRPDELARLLILAASLPAELMPKVRAIARGKSAAAPHAGAVLEALPR